MFPYNILTVVVRVRFQFSIMSCFDNTVKNCEGDVILYTNSKQIYDWVKDYIEIALHSMFGSLEGPDKGDLFIFDSLNNRFTEDFKMKVCELEEKRPSWKNTIIPFIIQKQQLGGNPFGLFLFDTIWYDVSYDVETYGFLSYRHRIYLCKNNTILFSCRTVLSNALLNLFSSKLYHNLRNGSLDASILFDDLINFLHLFLSNDIHSHRIDNKILSSLLLESYKYLLDNFLRFGNDTSNKSTNHLLSGKLLSSS